MFNFSLTSCQSKTKLKLKWQPSVSAPELYPAKVYNGDFWLGDHFVSLPTGGFLEEGWGNTGLTEGYGEFIPDTLDITWFSVAENKFYAGTFGLPVDTMKTLFDQGVMTTYGILEPYDLIVVNMAPGGIVVVWMKVSGARQVEIGRYQATETNIEFKYLMPQGEQDREKYMKDCMDRNPEMAKNLEENGINYDLYDSYRIRYPWNPKLLLPDEGKTKCFQIIFYNGEKDYLWGEFLTNNFIVQKALPEIIYSVWYDEKGNPFGSDIFFDEKEVFEAFKEIYKDNKEQETELVFVPDKKYKNLNVYLRSKTEEYELRKTKAIIYEKSKDTEE